MTSPKANASPTKAFFVRMLTRDISLDDCILDLVDNSIDGAWQSTNQRPSELIADEALSDFAIDIRVSEDSFRIVDNCGGITLNEAENYAFTFGRRESEPQAEFSVGVYGIGMKRAVFKLGKSIRITSTYEEDGKLIGFVVPIEVDDWGATENAPWDFDIDNHVAATQPGVAIEVTDLSEETKQRFRDPEYEKALRRLLGRDYLLPLMRGIKISVNGIPVDSRPLLFRQSDEFVPMRHKYDDDDGVAVEILAGMASAPPNDIQPEEPSRTDRTSGWYVLCNGRVVLAADRSAASGWGVSRPAWHPQYNGFIGVVLFSAAEPAKLPMTTTKRNVDLSSAVYRRALVQMDRPTRLWIDYTNTRKSEQEAAERLEQSGDTISISNVSANPVVGLPRLSPPGKPRERVANVNYSVSLKRMRELAAALEIDLNYREVGVRSFDYAYEVFVDEDK